MPAEYLKCVADLMKKGKNKKEAQKICAIKYYNKYGITPQQAEKQFNSDSPPLLFSDSIDLYYALHLPPEKAVEYFRNKGYTFSWDWQEIWQKAHARAFTVAKAMRLDILQDIRELLQKSLNEGITFQQFKKELEPRLKAKGWWGKVKAQDVPGYDPDSGIDPDDIVKLGSPWRLRTIYHTNMQTSYMAGRHQAFIENARSRPYWQYVAVLDSRTRPSHRALHSKVFRYDDPFWDAFYPPNGWGCRCRVRALSKRDLERRGLTVESGAGQLTTEDRIISQKTGETRQVTVYTDPITGEKIAPDPGWSYNPGKAAWQPDLNKYDYDIAHKYIESAIFGPDFIKFFKGEIEGIYPVAVLNKELCDLIKAKNQVIYLSSETLKKNLKKHKDINLPIYQKLPQIIENAELIVQDKENTLVFLKINNEYYFSSIKATQTGKALFVTTLHKVREKEIKRIKRRGKIIRDKL